MKRISIQPRKNYQYHLENNLDFHFHTINNKPYWNESAFYEFTESEIKYIETSSQTLSDMCYEAVQYSLEKNLLKAYFDIPEKFHDYIKESWNKQDKDLYGRFDLCLNKDKITMLEYNADTPTSLYEASVVQWDWLKEIYPEKDQFNFIHEILLECFPKMGNSNTLYFSSVKDNEEDYCTTRYLQDCAKQSGLKNDFIFIEDIGSNGHEFLDLNNNHIENLFKLYPWEWLVNEEFSDVILKNKTKFIEPSWKMLLSNKALLVVLWEMYGDETGLLEKASFEKFDGSIFKPILGREGSNINSLENTIYKDQKMVYHNKVDIPNFDNNYAIIGSWVVGGLSCGIGIREDDTFITKNTSRFVPHCFV